MRGTRFVILISAWLSLSLAAQSPRDSEQLGMALEYFQSGKYHEALLLFEKLDKDYALNPRYHAYMGICFYYEWLYEEACKYLDEAIPQLEGFAPHERSVYYYTAGESHFQLRQFQEAIFYFEKALTVCYEQEKGDIHYRLGLCHMFIEDWNTAKEQYDDALSELIRYRDTPDMQARIYQTAHMLKGCERKHEQLHPKETGAEEETAAAEKSAETEKEKEADIIMSQTSASPTDSTTASVPIDTKPSTLSTPSTLPLTDNGVVKDTIHTDIPQTINIQDIFEQKVDIRE